MSGRSNPARGDWTGVLVRSTATSVVFDYVLIEWGPGALLIPNAVALVRGGPHSQSGRALITHLLSAQVEQQLAQGSGAQIPIRNDVPGPSIVPPLSQLKILAADYDAMGRAYERMLRIVDEEWAPSP